MAVATEALGPDHLDTLLLAAKAARITLAQTGNAEPLREVVGRMEAGLGREHRLTVKYTKVLDGDDSDSDDSEDGEDSNDSDEAGQ